MLLRSNVIFLYSTYYKGCASPKQCNISILYLLQRLCFSEALLYFYTLLTTKVVLLRSIIIFLYSIYYKGCASIILFPFIKLHRRCSTFVEYNYDNITKASEMLNLKIFLNPTIQKILFCQSLFQNHHRILKTLLEMSFYYDALFDSIYICKPHLTVNDYEKKHHILFAIQT